MNTLNFDGVTSLVELSQGGESDQDCLMWCCNDFQVDFQWLRFLIRTGGDGRNGIEGTLRGPKNHSACGPKKNCVLLVSRHFSMLPPDPGWYHSRSPPEQYWVNLFKAFQMSSKNKTLPEAQRTQGMASKT